MFSVPVRTPPPPRCLSIVIPPLPVLTRLINQDSPTVCLHFDGSVSGFCRFVSSAAHRATSAACYDSHAESLYLCCSNGSAPTPLTFIIYGCSQTQTSAYGPVGSSLCLLFPLPFFYSFLSRCLEIASLAFVTQIFCVAGPLEEPRPKYILY